MRKSTFWICWIIFLGFTPISSSQGGQEAPKKKPITEIKAIDWAWEEQNFKPTVARGETLQLQIPSKKASKDSLQSAGLHYQNTKNQNLNFEEHKSSTHDTTSSVTEEHLPAAVDLAWQRPYTNQETNNNAKRKEAFGKEYYIPAVNLSKVITWPPTLSTKTRPSPVCHTNVDLAFVVESSTSVGRTGPGNYRRLMNFVKHVIMKFTILPSATRVGVVTYAHWPYLLFGFNTYHNIHQVLHALSVNPVRHVTSIARTGLALSFTHHSLFYWTCPTPRPRKKVLIVITDGSSSDDVYIPAQVLKQSRVNIFAVGVGRYFNIHQLNAMASSPVDRNVFTGDFSKIHHVRDELIRTVCQAVSGTSVSPHTSPCQC